MLNIDIQWGEPYQYKTADGIRVWKREWMIPIEFRSAFFSWWKTKSFALKSQGYGVSKKNLDWYIFETAKDFKSFKDIGAKKSPPPPEKPLIIESIAIKNTDGLRAWQIDTVGKLTAVINTLGCAVDGSDMGIGKTYAACGVARELDAPFIVVCPKAVKSQWKKVALDHFKMHDKFLGVINYELLIRGRQDSDICTLVQDRSTRRKKIKWKLPKNTLIIYDESHKLKNFTTKNSKFCMDAWKNDYKMLFLSATMAVNPIELRTIGTCLGMFKTAPEYYEWLANHGCTKGIWAWEFNNNKEILKKLNKNLFEERGVRLRRDLVPNFPETEIIVDAYDLDDDKTEKINATYRKMREEIKRLNKLKDKSTNELTIRLRNRQIVELLKTDLFIELAEEGLEAGMSIIIFVNYSESVDTLCTALNTKCVFDGRLKDSERNKNLQDFQDNKERIIIVNLKAGSMGLNMPDLDGLHPRLSLISPDDSAVAIKQSLGRAVRENSKSKTIQKIVLANRTIETAVMDNLKQKLDNLELINDGDLKL